MNKKEELAEDIQAYLVMDGIYLDWVQAQSLADCLLTDEEWRIERVGD